MKALIETRDLWTKIGIKTEAERSHIDKSAVPGPHLEYLHRCPCCEYAKTSNPAEGPCLKCPMQKQWGCKDGEVCHYHCEEEESPYLNWCIAAEDLCIDIAFWAYLIADLAQEAIDQLQEGEKRDEGNETTTRNNDPQGI